MGYDTRGFSPWAQKQIMQKLAERERKKDMAALADLEKKKNKYNNVPTSRETDGKTLRFDSKKEARRYDELMMLLKAGQIRDLHLQQNFTLQEAYTLPNGNRVRAIVYKADFCYERKVINRYQEDGGCSYTTVEEWVKVVEDVKSRATKTRVYAIKRKLMQEKFGIQIVEIE